MEQRPRIPTTPVSERERRAREIREAALSRARVPAPTAQPIAQPTVQPRGRERPIYRYQRRGVTIRMDVTRIGESNDAIQLKNGHFVIPVPSYYAGMDVDGYTWNGAPIDWPLSYLDMERIAQMYEDHHERPISAESVPDFGQVAPEFRDPRSDSREPALTYYRDELLQRPIDAVNQIKQQAARGRPGGPTGRTVATLSSAAGIPPGRTPFAFPQLRRPSASPLAQATPVVPIAVPTTRGRVGVRPEEALARANFIRDLKTRGGIPSNAELFAWYRRYRPEREQPDPAFWTPPPPQPGQGERVWTDEERKRQTQLLEAIRTAWAGDQWGRLGPAEQDAWVVRSAGLFRAGRTSATSGVGSRKG